MLLWSWECQLQIGTCHGCLPSTSTGIRSCAASVANLPHPLEEFKVESRNEVLFAQGITGSTGFQIPRYSQELISWAQFLYLLISRKALKSFMCNNCFLWLEVSQDQQKFSTKKYVLDCKCTPPLPKSHIHCPPCPLPLWSSFSELSEVLSPRPQSSYCLK